MHQADQKKIPVREHYWLSDLFLLTLFIGLGFAFLLGSRPLNVPDESRYCEIAREMLAMHNFITPHINGIKYFEKPPLFYWMQAGALHVFGLNEWACRFADALMGLIGCLSTYVAARKLFSRKTGLFSAIILSSSLLYFALARVVTLDMTVSIWLTLALFSFILGVYAHKNYYWFLYVFSGLAVLTKGLIGIIFPGSIIFVWLLFTREWKILKNCYLLRGIFLFLLITLPWHVLVQLKNPEFFHFYFIEQQFSRYFTLTAHRYQPDWFYVVIILLGLFPWTGFLWGAFKNITLKNHRLMFFLISFIFIFVFFSLSESKLVPYVLPCFPFLAVLLGNYFEKLEVSPPDRYSWTGFMVTSLICLSLVIAVPVYLTPDAAENFLAAQKWAYIIIIILVLNMIFIPVIFWKKNFLAAFKSQIILSILFLFSLCFLAEYIYMGSIKNIAVKLKAVLRPQDVIASYDYYYQDLPFYLQRTVTIVNWKGELAFGKEYPHAKNLMIDSPAFWAEWDQAKNNPDKHQKIYLLLPKNLLDKLKQQFPERKFHVWAQSKNDILITS